MNALASILRGAGDVANAAAAFAFGWATLALWSAAAGHWEAAGPLPPITGETLRAVLDDPAAYTGLWHLGAAWVLLVAALGCAWMTVLGVRWCHHFAVRLLDS